MSAQPPKNSENRPPSELVVTDANAQPERMPDRRGEDRPEKDRLGRRRHERYRGAGFHFMLDIDEHKRPVCARAVALMDISVAGAGLFQVEPVEVGDTFGLVFMKGGHWDATLTVVRHARAEPSGWIRVGMEFVDAGAEVEDRFIDYACENFGLGSVIRRKSA